MQRATEADLVRVSDRVQYYAALPNGSSANCVVPSNKSAIVLNGKFTATRRRSFAATLVVPWIVICAGMVRELGSALQYGAPGGVRRDRLGKQFRDQA